MKLKNLILASGLLALASCKDVKKECGELIITKVKITQKYTPAFSLFVDTFVLLPPTYLTTIHSNACTETLSDKESYMYFNKNKTEKLEYLNFYGNVYRLRHKGSEETVLLESRKVGCKFVIPDMEDKK